MKKIHLNNTMVIALIGFLWAIIGWILTSFLSSNFWKNNEIETRMFELKKQVYEEFLWEYYNKFNNNVFREKYEENFENIIAFNLHWYCSAGRSDLVLKNINSIKQDLENIILKCYYEYPYRCTSNTCYWLNYKENGGYSWFSLPNEIWLAQDEAAKKTVDDLFFEFKKNTYKYQLLLPKDIYRTILDQIEEKIYVAPNNYNDCNWSNVPECWFNFNYFDINWKIDILINDNILKKLRDDLQKHY